MPYRVKVGRHQRHRPVPPSMRELFSAMGIDPRINIDSHERAYVRRRPRDGAVPERPELPRRKPRRDDKDLEDREEPEDPEGG